MRKRLVENFTNAKKGSLGYTLTELLVVIGIIAIICAIAIPSIIAVRNALRFAQANNYAKSIFLAAQQNLTEMRSDGGLGPVQSAGGAQKIPTAMTTFPDEFRAEYVYTITGTQAFDRVLPAGSIDADVRDDQIVIEYNPLTGNVYAVFYYDKGVSSLDLAGEYAGGGLPRDKSDRRELMVGYYDGSGLNSSQIELEQTQAVVEFINGEEGIVRVKVPMPESFYGDFSEFASGLNITLSISGEWTMAQPVPEGEQVPTPIVIPIKSSGNMDGCQLDVDGRTVVVEYSIDSLANCSSFANYASNTMASTPGAVNSGASLTTLESEDRFIYNVLPGENVTIQADVTFDGSGDELVKIAPGILSGVNPMFEYLQPMGDGSYVLAISNGRNLQNLNVIAPTIADMVDSVIIISDINWNDTVVYYNNKYGTLQDGVKIYNNASNEAPARALPYFVPIHNAALFGTAHFIYPNTQWSDFINQLPDGSFKDIISDIFSPKSSVPTLTDELDARVDPNTGLEIAQGHANITGSDVENNDGVQIYYLNIDSTRNAVGKAFYAGTAEADIDRFTGLFGYVNSSIDNIHIINPIIKGYAFNSSTKNNPATGALLGAGGFNTYISNCSVYLDKNDPNFSRDKMNGQSTYNKDAVQSWYGVSGEGAVGGLVGYAKSHLNVSGALSADKDVLAFYNSFAAVNVSGTMHTPTRKSLSLLKYYYGYDKDYGYSTGVGGFIGNSQLTNFYNCYASGNVIAVNTNVADSFETKSWVAGFLERLAGWFGIELDFRYNGRESVGAGGFVGTSHGTRYTNCFATGSVSATNSSRDNSDLGSGGFLGVMCIDETFAYGNQNDDNINATSVAQRTVLTNCYSVGRVYINGVESECFSGATCRIAVNINEFATAQVGDYYRLLAPHYVLGSELGPNSQKGQVPSYEDFYIFKDTYYLNRPEVDDATNSNNCASPVDYDTLTDLPFWHQNDSWIEKQINNVKAVIIVDNLFGADPTYESQYFKKDSTLADAYRRMYKEGFSIGWESANAQSTHGYDLNGTYPFSKISGLDYYGDWPALELNRGVAYYEEYQNSNIPHYYFDRESTSTLQHDAGSVIVKDGYAILSSSNSSMTISVNNVQEVRNTTDDVFTAGTMRYHVYMLSDAQMAAATDFVRTTGQFYVPVVVGQDGSFQTFYFNPNIALSQVNGSSNHTYSGTGVACSICQNNYDHAEHQPTSTDLAIRSARQFSKINEMSNYISSEYRYIQQTHIDASIYEWISENDKHLKPIGTEDQPFNSTYRGIYVDANGALRQYQISGFESADAGFFGVIGDEGSVSDLIIECEEFSAGSDIVDNAAILAAVNYGIIDNVDMAISSDVTLSADKNAGLLAGLTRGKITNCGVTSEVNSVITIHGADNAGGLIGFTQGTADAMPVLTDCTLTVDGQLIISECDGNAGGIIGNALYLSAEKVTADLNTITSDALYTGGLAGCAEKSNFTGFSGNTLDNPLEVIIADIISTHEAGYAAGVIGSAKSTVLTGIDTDVHTVTGNIVAGFLGSGEDTDATNCDVLVSEALTGTMGAAGVAGTIGSQSVFNDVPVQLSGVIVEGKNAAGYVLEIKGDAHVMGGSHVTMGTYTETATKTTISATDSAAGFVITNSGSVGESHVIGYGEISGDQAAGYVITANGNISGSHVSPALSADANGYLGNANDKLSVTGISAAAGFAMTTGKDCTISNSYTLCKITSEGSVMVKADSDNPADDNTASSEGETVSPSDATEATDAPAVEVSAVYGFVVTNNGTINRCMANVDLEDGFAFVGINDGLVTTSYGWYGDGDRDTATTTRNEMLGSGKCYSSYFADLAPVKRSEKSVVVYDDKGVANLITPTMLQTVELSGFKQDYNAYPYQTITPPEYPYPMLRDHYGNWITPPQYAYGVAYYEIYTDNSIKLHMLDLSDQSLTEEGEIEFRNDIFNNDGEISQAGYAMFYNSIVGEQVGTKVFSETIGDYTYDFYRIDTAGIHTIENTIGNSKAAVIDTRFAKAMKEGEQFGSNEIFEVRTAQQLANIAENDATYSFCQTHDIETDNVTSATIGQNYSYEGNNLQLTISNQSNTWLTEVNGTVQNLNLTVNGASNNPVFGTVSGTVSLNTVKIGSITENGALVGSSTGIIETGMISTGEISQNGKLFGAITAGEVTVSAITTNGNAVNGSIFSVVSSSVEVSGGITTGAVNGQIFGEVGADVTTGAISVGEIGSNAKVFGIISGGKVTVGSITTNGSTMNGSIFSAVNSSVEVSGGITTGAVNGQIFGEVGADVTTGAISVGEIGSNAKVFDTVSGGKVTVDSITTNGSTVNGSIFSAVNSSVEVSGGITTGAVNGQIFGEVGADVTTGAISVGEIGSSAKVFDTISGGNTKCGTINTGDVSASDKWLIQSVTGGTVILDDIQVNNKSVVNTISSTEEENAEGIVTKTTQQSEVFNSVPIMIGEISGGEVTTGSVNLGKAGLKDCLISSVSDAELILGDVTVGDVSAASNWLITSVCDSDVTLGNVTVDNARRITTIVETTDENGVTTTTENTGIDGYNSVTTMIGTISGGTVSGSDESASTIELGGANINGNLIASVTEGANLRNIHVNTSGSLGASLIGSVSGVAKTDSTEAVVATVDNVDVTVNCAGTTVSGSGLLVDTLGENAAVTKCDVVSGVVDVSAQTFGGITGQVPASATLTNNTVNAVLNVTGNADTVIGGLVGINSGDVSMNGTSNVTINYRQGGDYAATIGGLIGQMNGGSLTGAGSADTPDAVGSINLDGSGSGYRFIIGGAVGMDCGTVITVNGTATHSTQYSNVYTEVTISEKWAHSQLVNVSVVKYFIENSDDAIKAICPAMMGPVGKFVGYVSGGSFENCSAIGTETNAAYQFLGEIEPSVGYLLQISAGRSDYVTSFTAESGTYEKGTDKGLTDWYTGEIYPAETAYRNFNAYLSNCQFNIADSNGNNLYYYQILDHANYYFYSQSSTKTITNYTITDAVDIQFNSTSFTRNDVKQWGERSVNDDNFLTLEMPYYHVVGNKYYRVYIRTYKEGFIIPTRYAEFYYLDEQGGTHSIQTMKRNSGSWDNYNSTMYLPAIQLKDGTSYLIAQEGTNGILIMNNGTLEMLSTKLDGSEKVFSDKNETSLNEYRWVYQQNSLHGYVNTGCYLASVDGNLAISSAAVAIDINPIVVNGTASGTMAVCAMGTSNRYNLYHYDEFDHSYIATLAPTGEFNHICWYKPVTNLSLTEEIDLPAVSGETPEVEVNTQTVETAETTDPTEATEPTEPIE